MSKGIGPCPECEKEQYILDCVKCEVRCINCGYIVPWIKVRVIPPQSDDEITTVEVHYTNLEVDKEVAEL